MINIIGVIIAIIIALGIIAALFHGIVLGFAQLLFNPRVNSIVTIILCSFFTYPLLLHVGLGALLPLALIALIDIDCVHDFALAHQLYDYDITTDEVDLDKFYVIKSVLTLLTFGMARIAYLLIVNPYYASKARHKVASDLQIGGYVNLNSYPYGGMASVEGYYLRKYFRERQKKGDVFSLRLVADEEIEGYDKKKDSLTPQGFFGKAAEKIGAKLKGELSDEMKTRKEIENKRMDAAAARSVYVSADFLDEAGKRITDYLENRANGSVTPYDICLDLRDELNLHLDHRAGPYLVIAALQRCGKEKVRDLPDALAKSAENHWFAAVGKNICSKRVLLDNDPMFALQ